MGYKALPLESSCVTLDQLATSPRQQYISEKWGRAISPPDTACCKDSIFLFNNTDFLLYYYY